MRTNIQSLLEPGLLLNATFANSTLLTLPNALRGSSEYIRHSLGTM